MPKICLFALAMVASMATRAMAWDIAVQSPVVVGSAMGMMPGFAAQEITTNVPMIGRQTEVEALGQDKVHGVRAEGTLHTTTYPAHAFGTLTAAAEVLSVEEPDAAFFEVPVAFNRLQPGPRSIRPLPAPGQAAQIGNGAEQ